MEKKFSCRCLSAEEKFHHHEPIHEQEIDNLTIFLEGELQLLISELKNFNINHLIGASGSFDTIAKIIASAFYEADILRGKTSFIIPFEKFHWIVNDIVLKNLEERLAIEGMIPFRAEMMVVAAILAKFITDKFKINKITQSSFALKEGVLWRIIQNENS